MPRIKTFARHVHLSLLLAAAVLFAGSAATAPAQDQPKQDQQKQELEKRRQQDEQKQELEKLEQQKQEQLKLQQQKLQLQDLQKLELQKQALQRLDLEKARARALEVELVQRRAEVEQLEQRARLKMIEAKIQGAEGPEEAKVRVLELQRLEEMRVLADQMDRVIVRRESYNVNLRPQFETQLKAAIDEIDRVCALTEEQKKKLQLAGRGDLNRHFNRLEETSGRAQLAALGGAVNADEQRVVMIEAMQAAEAAQRDLVTLRSGQQGGFFHQNSLFHKALRNTLTDAQLNRYDNAEVDRRTARHRTNVEAALRVLERGNPLTPEQRRDVLALMLQQTKPAGQANSQEQQLILVQLGRIADQKLKPLVEAEQWERMSLLLGRMRVLEPQFKQAGLLPPDE